MAARPGWASAGVPTHCWGSCTPTGQLTSGGGALGTGFKSHHTVSLACGVGDGDVRVKSSQHAGGSGERGVGGSLPRRWARTAEQEELTVDDTGPGEWALQAAPGGQAPLGIAAPACDARVLTGEQSQPGGPGWE